MTTVVEAALKDKSHNCRMTCGHRFLVWGEHAQEWAVREQRPHAKRPHVVVYTQHLGMAVAALLAETGDTP